MLSITSATNPVKNNRTLHLTFLTYVFTYATALHVQEANKSNWAVPHTEVSVQEGTNREFTQHRVSEVKDMPKQALFPWFASLGDWHYTAAGHVVLGNTRMIFGSTVTTLARETVGSLLCSCPSSESETFSLRYRPNHVLPGETDLNLYIPYQLQNRGTTLKTSSTERFGQWLFGCLCVWFVLFAFHTQVPRRVLGKRFWYVATYLHIAFLGNPCLRAMPVHH